jgi:hypothetical protein
MAEIVNLRQARKARDRKRAEQQAAENRAKFGRTKAEKTKQQLDDARDASRLDGARRETDDNEGID